MSLSVAPLDLRTVHPRKAIPSHDPALDEIVQGVATGTSPLTTDLLKLSAQFETDANLANPKTLHIIAGLNSLSGNGDLLGLTLSKYQKSQLREPRDRLLEFGCNLIRTPANCDDVQSDPFLNKQAKDLFFEVSKRSPVSPRRAYLKALGEKAFQAMIPSKPPECSRSAPASPAQSPRRRSVSLTRVPSLNSLLPFRPTQNPSLSPRRKRYRSKSFLDTPDQAPQHALNHSSGSDTLDQALIKWRRTDLVAQLQTAIRHYLLETLKEIRPAHIATQPEPVRAHLDRINNLTVYLSLKILQQRTKGKKEAHYFLNILFEILTSFIEIKFYEGAMVIYNAIQDKSVARLFKDDRTSPYPPPLKRYEDEVIDAKQRWTHFRNKAKDNPRLLPIVSLLNQDVGNILETNPLRNEDNALNWNRFHLYGSAINDIVPRIREAHRQWQLLPKSNILTIPFIRDVTDATKPENFPQNSPDDYLWRLSTAIRPQNFSPAQPKPEPTSSLSSHRRRWSLLPKLPSPLIIRKRFSGRFSTV